jgi:hypothetical protein
MHVFDLCDMSGPNQPLEFIGHEQEDMILIIVSRPRENA